MLRVRSHDDRGSPVRLAHAGVAAWVRGRVGELTRIEGKSRARLVWRVMCRVVLTGPFLALVGACAILAILARLLAEDLSTGLGLMVFSPVAVPLITLGLATTRGVLGFGGRVPERMRRAMLAQWRCPACGYDLRGVMPEGDGCVVCSECSAAWAHAQTGAGAMAGPEVVVIQGFSERG